MRAGDLIELRWEPNIEYWALLLVVALTPAGAEVRELMHKHIDDLPDVASLEAMTGFRAEMTGINQWQVIRDADGQLMPGLYPTKEAARTEIMQNLAPKFAGRGWARSS